MSRVFTFVLIVALAINLCHGYTFFGEANTNDGKCVSFDDESLHVVGEDWYNDERCEKFRCYISDGKYYISGMGCGSVSAPENCTLQRKPGHYPECCPSPVCN